MRKLLVLIFLASACSGSGSDGPLLTFADLENATTTTAGTATSTSEPSTPATTTTSTTLLVVDVPAPVTIQSEAGWSVLTGRGAPTRLLDEPVEVAFDDLMGGVLFQFPGAGADVEADQRVFWSRSASPEAQPFIDVIEPDTTLKLWGVEEVEGRPQAILTVIHDFNDPEARREDLVLYDFLTGDAVLATVGGWESGPAVIDYAGGKFIIERGDEALTAFQFRDVAGNVVELASNPHPGCLDDPTCPAHPALDSSGGLLAYVQRSADETSTGVELVVRDIDLGEEIQRIPLPPDLSRDVVVDFDGSTALINHRVDGDYQALVVDVGSGTVGNFGLAGLVRFLRVLPEMEGPIQIVGR